MKNLQVKTATAYYTGGGIYIYTGQLKNGLYLRGCDDWGSIAICNKNTDTEEADYSDFYDEYLVEEVTGSTYKKLFNSVIDWIITHKPDGNYLESELQERIIK